MAALNINKEWEKPKNQIAGELDSARERADVIAGAKAKTETQVENR